MYVVDRQIHRTTVVLIIEAELWRKFLYIKCQVTPGTKCSVLVVYMNLQTPV